VTAKGTNLSGGQRQRLLIARAIAGEPSLLILDDASSALDYQTDANLRGAIRRELQDTTTVVVAQRVSSVQHADLILVLENGRIIGAGRHEQLLDCCDVYREISESQMGGALLE
jgi:ATP-binding cassette subfamily B protein